MVHYGVTKKLDISSTHYSDNVKIEKAMTATTPTIIFIAMVVVLVLMVLVVVLVLIMVVVEDKCGLVQRRH